MIFSHPFGSCKNNSPALLFLPALVISNRWLPDMTAAYFVSHSYLTRDYRAAMYHDVLHYSITSCYIIDARLNVKVSIDSQLTVQDFKLV